jgi:hypothetical protein
MQVMSRRLADQIEPQPLASFGIASEGLLHGDFEDAPPAVQRDGLGEQSQVVGLNASSGAAGALWMSGQESALTVARSRRNRIARGIRPAEYGSLSWFQRNTYGAAVELP